MLQKLPSLYTLFKVLLANKVVVHSVLSMGRQPQSKTFIGAPCTYALRKALQRLHGLPSFVHTCSPCLGERVVWEQEKPNRRGELSISFLMSVPLPTPEGPHITRAEGFAATCASFCPSDGPCPSSEEYVPPISSPRPFNAERTHTTVYVLAQPTFTMIAPSQVSFALSEPSVAQTMRRASPENKCAHE